jgi:acetyltransferase-like isoleucine patch superfamily enzyme
MTILKKIKAAIKKHFGPVQVSEPFFTKDIFREKKFIIGDYTYGKPDIIFENGQANFEIGKFCSIAEGVTIFLGGNHRTDWVTTFPFNSLPQYFPEGKSLEGHPATKGSVIIGHDVWIGKNATIMSGITIGNGAVIATAAVITKTIGPYEIWGGNPARLLKKRFDDETIEKLQEVEWWNWDIAKIKQKMPDLCAPTSIFLNNLKISK